MRTTLSLVAIAMLATAIGGPALAAGRNRSQEPPTLTEARVADDVGQGMQAVPNNATPQDRAHGWRYFSDPKAGRAVVISPQGDYYLSQGQGLRWVAGAQA
ncbi:MAG: hypothetical protein KGL78_03490 [Burkholderiales bacterium]|nr:hypothetical protein [Burkholderiales bacterium]